MSFQRLGIIGAGTMGSGIAIATAAAGVPVRIVDISADSVKRALDGAATFYDRSVEKNRMAAADAAAAKDRLTGGTEMEALADCDLIVEAVFEDLDIKKTLFGKINPIAAKDAVLATNTSCLKVSDIAAAVDNPSRFLGLHYFSPAQVNPLVEVVRGAATDDAVFERALGFVKATGKTALRCKDQRGFAVNRFFCPYINEATRLLDEGVGDPATIDKVANEALGAAAGPFLVMNLVKPRIALDATKNLEPLGSFYTPAKSLVTRGTEDQPWEIGEPQAPEAARDDIIAARLMGGTFLAVLQEIDEDVASPSDIDIGAKLALKFGKPPCAEMDRLGRVHVEGLLKPICEAHGTPLPKSLDRVGGLIG